MGWAGHRVGVLLARGRGWAALGIALLAAGCGSADSKPDPGAAAREIQPGLVLVRSGWLVDYHFRRAMPTAALEKYFELNGSAPPSNASVSVQADGLHVGVERHAPGAFEGFFAVTDAAFPATSVFHVSMSREADNVTSPSQTGEAVFAVQTGTTKRTGEINYVLVASVTNAGRTHWEVGYAQGRVADASTKILWISPPSPTAPVNEDITLRTNGGSSYVVYFGDRVVYASNRLNMAIVPPFQAYLEVQALEIPYQSRFQDFWITSDSSILVEGLHPGDRVALAPPKGASAVAALADASGQARLQLPPPEAAGTGTLTIQSGTSLRHFPGLRYAGGDIYRVVSGP